MKLVLKEPVGVVAAFLLALLATSSFRWASAADSWVTTSPDQRQAIRVTLEEVGTLSYSVTHLGKTVVLRSPCGLVTEASEFIRGLSLIDSGDLQVDHQHYKLFTGPQAEVNSLLHRRTLSFRSADGKTLHVDCVASNQGVAFRYRLDVSEPQQVQREATEVRLKFGSTGWLTPYHTGGPHTPNNEDFYFPITVGDPPPTSRASAAGWAMPALFRVANGGPSVLVCESSDVGTFCGRHLVNGAKPGAYVIELARADETKQMPPQYIKPLPTIASPGALPWLVFLVGEPSSFVESTLVTDLAPPSRIKDTRWIRSGRASWSWLTQPEGPYQKKLFDEFSELASDYGWEYTTFDGGWWDVDLGEIARHARLRGVRPLVWMYSGDCWEATQRRQKLDAWKHLGVAGVKIDFWASHLQPAMQTIAQTLEAAAERRMVVVLHGCPAPLGWQRTWPNLLSCEAALGLEGYLYDDRYPEKVAQHNCLLPFTRNVVGPMDVTPFRLSPLGTRRLTTAAHELATVIVHSSGIIHYADSPAAYGTLPGSVKKVLRLAPATWDETSCPIGNPGKLVVVARRTENTWFVAGINGQDEPASVDLDLDRLGLSQRPFTAIVEGSNLASEFSEHELLMQSRWKYTMPPRGGFVLMFQELDPE